MEKDRRHALLSWASMGLLVVLCSVMTFLQYRWTGEVSRAERDRLRTNLESALGRLSRDFNNEIAVACAALVPAGAEIAEAGREGAYANRYRTWASAQRRRGLFRAVAMAVPVDESPMLSVLDFQTGAFSPSEWPESWTGLRDRLRRMLTRDTPREPFDADNGTLIEIPRFTRSERPGAPPRMEELEWLIVEVNPDYLRDVLLAELLQRHLGGSGGLEYDAEVSWRNRPTELIYRSSDDASRRLRDEPDGIVPLFEVSMPDLMRRGQRGRGGFEGRGGGRVRGMITPGRGRWLLAVRHRGGSLEAIVTRARWRNLAISAGVMLLILAAVAALVRASRRAHQLAESQMSFVAGVSHELRTPLTVIRTAAYNLKHRFSKEPSQVERYGSLIQHESEKLTALVEQVLRYASAQAGRVIREREPVAVESVIEQGLEASKAALAGAGYVVDKRVEPGLPLVLADEMALKHAFQNLLDNAVKYGTEGSNWIGVSASQVAEEGSPMVEVRIADRGPGIPTEEQKQVFDAFYRGKRALQDQVHGTGLGLNLVKRIVEAHGGTIRVRSEPMKGAEFVIRIPAAPAEFQDEFAHSVG